jgi:hypothetical protein
LVPDWQGWLIYDRQDDARPACLVHFSRSPICPALVRPDAAFLRWTVTWCGASEHSLLVFCIGTFLSFSARAPPLADPGGAGRVSIAGIGPLIAVAYIAGWYKRQQSA